MNNTQLLYKHSRRVLRSYLDTGDDDTLRAHEVAVFYYYKMFAAEAMERIKAGENVNVVLNEMNPEPPLSGDRLLITLNDMDREPPPIIAKIDGDSKPYPERNRKKGKGKRW